MRYKKEQREIVSQYWMRLWASAHRYRAFKKLMWLIGDLNLCLDILRPIAEIAPESTGCFLSK